jgi:4-hydroxybenzoate polyprenyltransferase
MLWFAAREGNRLLIWPWKFFRIAMGSTFLIALAADSRFFTGASLIPAPLPKSPLLYALLGAAALPVMTRLPEVLDDWRKNRLAGLLSSGPRFVGVVFYLAAFGFGISLLFYVSPDYPKDLAARATYSCLVYFAFWLLSGAYIIRKFFQRPPTGMAGQIIALLAVTRAVTSLLIGGAIGIVLLSDGVSLLVATLRALPLTLAAMGGFAVNDYFDKDRDYINRPYRPIPSGRISSATALWLGAGLLLLSGVLGVLVTTSTRECLIVFAGIFGATSYNLIVKCATCLKNVWTGALCSLPVVWFAIDGRLSGRIVVAVLIYVTGRELLMDIVDLPGDRANGILTIPARIGLRAAAMGGFTLILAGLVVFMYQVHAPIVSTLMLIAFGGAIGLWLQKGARKQATTVYVLWLPMLLGVIGLWEQ